ncbi:hypothetical protein C8Q79DRAFT_136753 [Trametes meyenii]|nr:hypothetical protein C8Q79DRAFT_136753 [Trametes meyenii]
MPAAERLLESIFAILAADTPSTTTTQDEDNGPTTDENAHNPNVGTPDASDRAGSSDIPREGPPGEEASSAEASSYPPVFSLTPESAPSSGQPNPGVFDLPQGHVTADAEGFRMDVDAFSLPLHMEELCRVPIGSFGTLPASGWAPPHDGQMPESVTAQGLQFDYHSFMQQNGVHYGSVQGFGLAGSPQQYNIPEGGSAGYMGVPVEGGSHQHPSDLPSFTIDFSALDMPPLEGHAFGAGEGSASDELRDLLTPFR